MLLQGSQELCKSLSIYFFQTTTTTTKNNPPHTANPSGGAGCTAYSPTLQGCPNPLWMLGRAPNLSLTLVLAPLHAPEQGREVAGEERTPGPSLFWCLGVLASVPCHQVPKGTTKSTRATAKRGPKGWGPSTAVASQPPPPDRKKLEEQRGPRESQVSRPAQPSVEEKQSQPSPVNLGAGGTLQLESDWALEGSRLRIPAPRLRQCWRCHHSSVPDLRRGPRAVGAARVMVSKPARGACDAGPLAGKPSLAFQLYL
uniref:Uncharacterized protein n=1 Tax=Molossus molossus TaxID=27622 RepID=A0A7J8HBS2_MOLMO|nr:hypothetical protein HJG59_011113 [Molossus molossus]